MISLRKLAQQTNVSVSTVSRALRDDPAVKGETRERIRKVAEKMNYMPNRLVEGVFTGRTKLVALICSEVSADPSSRKISSVVDEISRRGWGCVIYNTHGSEEGEARAIHQAISLRVSGLVISTVNYSASERFYWELNKYQVPYVLSSEYAPDAAVPHVHCDDFSAGVSVMDFLYQLGHRRIASLTGPEATIGTSLRHKGYLEGLSRHGLSFKKNWLAATDWTTEDARQKTAALLKGSPKFTAIFCANDYLAVGACQAIREAGLSVPKDISVVGCGDGILARYHTPPITTINQNLRLIGQKCVEALFSIMEGRRGAILSRKLLDTVVDPALIVRESTGPARKR